ncbi:MAG: sigma-70 family RNA polymerase sigma factor [Planctomycetota bacterium]
MNDTDSTDSIRRAMAGDAAAAAQLWRAHRRWVAAILLAHKPRTEDLDDLLQEVALTMVEKLTQLDDPGAFRGWLRSVAVNTARATGRKQTRRRGLLKLVRPEPQPDAAPAGGWSDPAGIERAERSKRLQGLVDELPESYRECVLLRCVRGMSHAEISAATGLPETTVETRIARGRRKLRQLAGEQANTNEPSPSAQAASS